MKRVFLLLFLVLFLFLSACSLPDDLYGRFSPVSYSVEHEHESTSQEIRLDDLTASNYEELCDSVRKITELHQTVGHIQVPTNYEGNLYEDSNLAVSDVWKNDPLASYSVDYISAECDQLLKYYEVTVSVAYRKSLSEIASIKSANSIYMARKLIQEALSQQRGHLTLRIPNYRDGMDCQKIVSDYCANNPETIMEEPVLTLKTYPDSGIDRILEMDLSYSFSHEELNNMRSAVSGVLSSAAGYVRYRKEAPAKANLLYSYLEDRFDYTLGESDTPMYSFLCEGVLNSKTAAQTMQILLERVEIPCRLVSGYLEGEPYYWIILTLDGSSFHADPFRDILEKQTDLRLLYDEDMTGFSWDSSSYPSCPAPREEKEEAQPKETEKAEEKAPFKEEEATKTEEKVPHKEEGTPQSNATAEGGKA